MPCNHCGNCHRDFTEIDMTKEARQVINCVYEMKGRYGLNIILGTLLGANRARLREIHAADYKTFGTLKDHSESKLRLLISQMILDGYLYQTADKYSVVRIGNIEPLRNAATRVLVRTSKDREEKDQVKNVSKKSTDVLTKAGYDLFENLRKLRLTIAREEGMPPYIIFSDKTLIDISAKIPLDKESLLNVSGVGVVKYEKYGERFIREIRTYLNDHPDSVTSIREIETTPDKKESPVKKGKKKKRPFYLNSEDGDRFEIKDFYSINEIRDELNRITTAENVKHLFGTNIFKVLADNGYVEEKVIGGRHIQVQTDRGLSKGIKTVEKISKSGNTYDILMYPPVVQKEIVRYYIERNEEADM